MQEQLLRVEQIAWDIVNDPTPYGDESPRLEVLWDDLYRAIRELVELVAGRVNESEDRALQDEFYELIRWGVPEIGPRDLSDWSRAIFRSARKILGWPEIDYWPTHGGEQ